MKGLRVKGIDPRILKLEIIPMRSDLPPTAELNTQLQPQPSTMLCGGTEWREKDSDTKWKMFLRSRFYQFSKCRDRTRLWDTVTDLITVSMITIMLRLVRKNARVQRNSSGLWSWLGCLHIRGCVFAIIWCSRQNSRAKRVYKLVRMSGLP